MAPENITLLQQCGIIIICITVCHVLWIGPYSKLGMIFVAYNLKKCINLHYNLS